MKDALEQDGIFNFSKATFLLVENSQHAVDLLAQIVKGFGAQTIYRCLSLDEAQKLLDSKVVDLVVTEGELSEGDACAFIRNLRMSSSPNNCVPVVMTRGHVRLSDLHKTRDIGVNYFIAKPVTPQVLLERILWVLRDKRPFVKADGYIGPDRRFKFEGPPPGSDGRRTEDLKDPLKTVSGNAMSQDEVDMLIKPQKVAI
jgi:DNA-binding response OmpR family regulator